MKKRVNIVIAYDIEVTNESDQDIKKEVEYFFLRNYEENTPPEKYTIIVK